MVSLRASLSSVLFLLLFSGCVSSPADSGSNFLPAGQSSLVAEVSSPATVSPGDPLTICVGEDEGANEECFEDAFRSCHRVTGTFWKTAAGDSLSFESQGVDSETQKCKVRITVLAEADSAFAGQSAVCFIAKTPSSEAAGESEYNVYEIGPSNCTGSLVEAIQHLPLSSESTPLVEAVSPAPAPAQKSFSFSVDDVSGPIGENEFHVMKGDKVTLRITTSTEHVSFGGAWTRAPAGPKLADETQYIFTTGTVAPGQTKDVEFIVSESFEFGVYWPGSDVLKGNGKIIVDAP